MYWYIPLSSSELWTFEKLFKKSHLKTLQVVRDKVAGSPRHNGRFLKRFDSEAAVLVSGVAETVEYFG